MTRLLSFYAVLRALPGRTQAVSAAVLICLLVGCSVAVETVSHVPSGTVKGADLSAPTESVTALVLGENCTPDASFDPDLQTVRGDLLAPSAPFGKGSTACIVRKAPRENINLLIHSEAGVKNGKRYAVSYADAAGMLMDKTGGGRWRTKCLADRAFDAHWCSIARDDVRLVKYDTGDYMVVIGGHYAPDTTIAIKSADGKVSFETTERTGFSERESKKIVSLIRKKVPLLTKFRSYDGAEADFKRADLSDADTALSLLDWLVKSVQR